MPGVDQLRAGQEGQPRGTCAGHQQERPKDGKTPAPKGYDRARHQSLWEWRDNPAAMSFQQARQAFGKADAIVNGLVESLIGSPRSAVKSAATMRRASAGKRLLSFAMHSARMRKLHSSAVHSRASAADPMNSSPCSRRNASCSGKRSLAGGPASLTGSARTAMRPQWCRTQIISTDGPSAGSNSGRNAIRRNSTWAEPRAPWPRHRPPRRHGRSNGLE